MAKGFSLAFFKRDTNTGRLSQEIGEYFFLNGPTSYSESYGQRLSVDPTFYGYTVTDFGNDISKISLEGEFAIYFYGSPQSRTNGADKFIDDVTAQGSAAAKSFLSSSLSDIFPVPGLTTRTGSQEFADFVGLLWQIRQDGSFSGIDAQAKGIVSAGGFQETDTGHGSFNYAEYGIVYRDYERRRFVEVVHDPSGFTVSRSVEDTNTYRFTLTLFGLKSEEAVFNEGYLSGLKNQASLLNPATIIPNALGAIDSVLRLPLQFSGALLSVTGVIKDLFNQSGALSDLWKDASKAITTDGKLLSQDFAAIEKSMFKAAGKKDKKAVLALIADGGNFSGNLNSYYSDFWQAFKDKVEQAGVSAEQLLNAAGISYLNPPPTPPSQNPIDAATVLPGWDSTPFIDNPNYDFIWQSWLENANIQAMLVFAEINYDFGVFQAMSGANYESIASAVLGDPSLSPALAEFNQDQVLADISGRFIRIPISRPTLAVYSVNSSKNPGVLEERLLGQDLALNDGRGFIADPTGDFAVLNGEMCYANNIIDMLDFYVGSLPYWPEWGNPARVGDMSTEWEKQRYIERIVQGIQRDSRTALVSMESVSQDGNRIEMRLKIRSIFGFQSHYFEL